MAKRETKAERLERKSRESREWREEMKFERKKALAIAECNPSLVARAKSLTQDGTSKYSYKNTLWLLQQADERDMEITFNTIGKKMLDMMSVELIDDDPFWIMGPKTYGQKSYTPGKGMKYYSFFPVFDECQTLDYQKTMEAEALADEQEREIVSKLSGRDPDDPFWSQGDPLEELGDTDFNFGENAEEEVA